MAQPERTAEESKSAFPIIDSRVTIIWDPGNKEFPCIFCKRHTIDELNLGPLYRLPEQRVVAHYFCMLFSAGLVQQGDDKQGILGFLPEDIFKEARRAQRLKCAYCQLSGASIGCNTSRCKTSFHFPCGLANEANFQFFKNYQSFCKSHSTLPETDLPLEERKCPICFKHVKPPDRPIIGQCCKTAIFHKPCLQQLALNAGYFYRCPTCNSQEYFSDNTKFQGIFVPEQDASWEREPNAYEDLYQSYNHCDATKCDCPKGRDYAANKGSWLLARCRICGSAGTHRLCGSLSTIANWACSDCLEVEARTSITIKPVEPIRTEPRPSTSAAAYEELLETEAVNSNSGKRLNANSSRKSKAVLAKDAANKSVGEVTSKTIVEKNKVAPPVNEDEGEQLQVAPKRIKRTGVPGELDLDEEEEVVDLSQIQIQLSSRDYFPLSKEAKKKLALEDNVFPDWRNYRLRVQMVDIFLDAMDAIEKPIRLKSRIRNKVIKSITNGDAVQFLKKPKQTDNLKTGNTIEKVPQVKTKRRYKRTSNWSKGWVKRKKKPVSSKQQPDPKSLLPDKCTREGSLGQNSAESTSSASASQAILVGIRRSRESLLQLKAQSSDKSEQDTCTTNGKSRGPRNPKTGKFEKVQNLSRRSRRSLEAALFSDNNSMNTETDSKQNESGTLLTNTDSTSECLSQDTTINGMSTTSSNDLSVVSSKRQEGSHYANGIPSRASQTTRSDKNPVRVGVDKDNKMNEKKQDLSHAGSRNGRPSLALELQQSAHGIARHLLNLQDQNEANAQLRILEMNCPQLFRGNLPM